MPYTEPALRAMHKAIAELNDLLPAPERLSTAGDTVLGGRLDSLGVVNLLLALERIVEENEGVTVSLMDLLEVDPTTSALATVERLTALVRDRMQAARS